MVDIPDTMTLDLRGLKGIPREVSDKKRCLVYYSVLTDTYHLGNWRGQELTRSSRDYAARKFGEMAASYI